MTPPVRPTWTLPSATTLEEALGIAKHQATVMQAAHTVCVRVVNGAVEYEVMLSGTYAHLRERGLAGALAPVASALPNGHVDLYRSITTRTPRGD